MKKIFLVLLSLIYCVAVLSVPAGAVSDVPIEDTARIVSDELFAEIEPTNVETTYVDGRVITVTTYTLDNGEIITDTFERSAMTTYSYEGTDTATRTVDGTFGSITLIASFKWWTSEGEPGTIGSWQSVECTSKTAVYFPVTGYAVKNKSTTSSEGEIKWGKAWAKASGRFYYDSVTGIVGNHNDYSIKITCDDNGNITNTPSV